MEKVFIDCNEMNQFIMNSAKEKGYNISEEIIELVLDLEMEFLDSKCLVKDVED